MLQKSTFLQYIVLKKEHAINLNLLRTFIRVADCGSLTKASKLLNHPKSKISRDLSKLEDEFEQTLMIRTSKGIRLTEQGFDLLQATRAQFESLENSLKQVKSDPHKIKGKIRLTAPEDLSGFILTRLIAEFIDHYPDVNIELYSTSQFLDFNKNDIDLALRIGKLEDSSLLQREIANIDVIFVGSTYYLKSNKPVNDMNDLASHSIALIKGLDGNPVNKEFLRNVTPKFSSNSMSVIKDFVSHGKGIATLPKFLCRKELAMNEFEQVLPNEVYISRGLYLLSRPASYIPNHVKVFKDFIFENLKKEL